MKKIYSVSLAVEDLAYKELKNFAKAHNLTLRFAASMCILCALQKQLTTVEDLVYEKKEK